MPFKTLYQIFDSKHTAPVFANTDYKMAYVEWRAYLRKGGDVYRLEQTVLPEEELTKSEKYLYLVYRVRKLWRRYFDCGRKKEDLEESLKLESELDAWNMRTKIFIETHCMVTNGSQVEAYNFYTTVQAWRDTWKERKRYSGKLDCDKKVLKEISHKCRDLERQIDDYIKRKFNLL